MCTPTCDLDPRSSEFRAIRALFFAQKCIAAGYTSICAPGDAGQISLSVRNAINYGLFDGPRVTAAGRYLTTRQGLTDWYPTWIGVPPIGRLVTSRDEAIEEIRVQVKNGVDCIKVALDGVQRRPDGEFIAAFNQEEINAIVTEAYRLGRKVVVHARGREATLYAARGRGPHLPCLLPRRRVHRRPAPERKRDRAHPHVSAQHRRLHPTHRACLAQGAHRRRAARVRDRLLNRSGDDREEQAARAPVGIAGLEAAHVVRDVELPIAPVHLDGLGIDRERRVLADLKPLAGRGSRSTCIRPADESA